MRISIVTDSWYPLINGVVTTLDTVRQELEKLGNTIDIIHPLRCGKSFQCPSYPEIKICIFPYPAVKSFLRNFKPDAIHIATEGPVGCAARRYCLHKKIPFTTSYHTKFPEYIRSRYPVPLSLSYYYLKNFHKKAKRTLVTTNSIKTDLEKRNFQNLIVWGRGVDIDKFSYKEDKLPFLLYVGRVSIEKNLEAFLSLEGFDDYKKIIVGDGPDLVRLKEKYPNAEFVGYKKGNNLIKYFQSASCFVFPSKTDTFGLVILEANACGTPVAAYPCPGPIDIIKNGKNGYLNNNLHVAITESLKINPESCRNLAKQYSWKSCSLTLLHNLEIIKN